MDAGGVRVAVVQRPPVLLGREATLSDAVGQVQPAPDAGGRLVVFFPRRMCPAIRCGSGGFGRRLTTS
jgi:hypothetical protein